ncbi:MAG: HNH endonuclease signature motif containing protein [Verrucomicrobiia bacterium]|jgi:hypothetical protein
MRGSANAAPSREEMLAALLRTSRRLPRARWQNNHETPVQDFRVECEPQFCESRTVILAVRSVPKKVPAQSPTRNYKAHDLKLLWGLAQARCAYPACRKLLIKEATEHDREAVIGKIAHIISISPNGPRHDSTKTADFLNSYANLLLLCANHHDEVDAQASTFTVETLLRWKKDHEAWVFSRLEQAASGVGFAELEVVCSAWVETGGKPSDVSAPTAPAEKMKKNGLTDKLRPRLSLGLSLFPEVESFVQGFGRLDSTFPERLKTGFVKRYNECLAREIKGDALFEALHDFASAGSSNFVRQAAGLGVLCYLFQKCEVFEP